MIAALIVAGGSGLRLGADIPKQYLEFAGKPILYHTIKSFEGLVDVVSVVISPAHRHLYDKAVAGLRLGEPITGGDERQDSVLCGLESLQEQAPDVVLIHDAVRPFVGKPIIDSVIRALDEYEGAIPVVPVKDTIKMVEADIIQKTIPRGSIFAAQTPQAFRFKVILEAHRKAKQQNLKFTDDAAVLEYFSIPVKAIAGSEENFKITTAEDLSMAENKISASYVELRKGHK